MNSSNPDSKTRATRVLIVDDHPVVREGLAAQIAAQRDLEVCGEAEDVAGALAVFERTRPDIAIIDISLKNGNGLDLVKRLRARDEAIRIVGPDVAVQGNIDPALLQAPWPVLEAHVRAVIARGRGAKGHILNLGHGVPPETDPDQLTRIVELAHSV